MPRRGAPTSRRQGRGRGDAPVVAGERGTMTQLMDPPASDRTLDRRAPAPRVGRRSHPRRRRRCSCSAWPRCGSGGSSTRRASAGDTVEVRVDDGWSVSRIGDELVDRDVIGSSLVFNVYTRLKGDADFQAGTYDLERDMGVQRRRRRARGRPDASTTSSSRCRPGCGSQEIATRVGEQLPGRSSDAFLAAVRSGAKRSKYQPGGQHLSGGLALARHLPHRRHRRRDRRARRDGERVRAATPMPLGLETATSRGEPRTRSSTIASLIEAEAKVPTRTGR